jgi:hypothetical protein
MKTTHIIKKVKIVFKLVVSVKQVKIYHPHSYRLLLLFSIRNVGKYLSTDKNLI